MLEKLQPDSADATGRHCCLQGETHKASVIQEPQTDRKIHGKQIGRKSLPSPALRSLSTAPYWQNLPGAADKEGMWLVSAPASQSKVWEGKFGAERQQPSNMWSESDK